MKNQYRDINLKSSSWITDASGSVNQYLAYLPFGEQFIDQRQTGHDIRFKFTGKERDAETGMDYFGARYYDSGLSVWLSARPPKLHSLHKKVYTVAKRRWVDPLADKYPSMSPFMYTAGNPVMLVDPDGMRIIGSKEEKKAFKNRMKAEGRWKDIRKKYRGKKKDLVINANEKSKETIGTATIESTQYEGWKDYDNNRDWFVFNPNSGEKTRSYAAHEIPVSIVPSIPSGTIDIERGKISMSKINLPNLNFVLPQPININVSAQFLGGQTRFRNSTLGLQQLQTAANAFLNNPQAIQIIINIGTSSVNLNQPSTNPDNRSVDQLLRDRGIVIRNQLLQMGIPMSAFKNNWLQFSRGTSASMRIRVR